MSSCVEDKIEGREPLLLAQLLVNCPIMPLCGLKAMGLDWATVRKAAEAAFKAGRYTEARRLRELELTIARKHSPYGIRVAHTLNSLGVLMSRCGEHRQAKRLFLQALELFELERNQQKNSISTVLGNLGNSYYNLDNLVEAEANLDKSLLVGGGIDQADAILKVNVLALIYSKQNKIAKAEEMMEKMRSLTEREYGQSHPYYALYYNNLGGIYATQKRDDDAQCAFLKAIAIYTKTLRPRHPSVAAPLENWAQMQIRQGRLGAAEPLLRRAVSIREEACGADSPRLLVGLQALADLLRKTERAGEAEEVERRIREIKARDEH